MFRLLTGALALAVVAFAGPVTGDDKKDKDSD